MEWKYSSIYFEQTKLNEIKTRNKTFAKHQNAYLIEFGFIYVSDFILDMQLTLVSFPS